MKKGKQFYESLKYEFRVDVGEVHYTFKKVRFAEVDNEILFDVFNQYKEQVASFRFFAQHNTYNWVNMRLSKDYVADNEARLEAVRRFETYLGTQWSIFYLKEEEDLLPKCCFTVVSVNAEGKVIVDRREAGQHFPDNETNICRRCGTDLSKWVL